jgi:hypothetical protein
LAKKPGRSILDSMMNLLTRTMRFKAAAFMAVLYALIVLAPHAAVAFAGPSGAVHCLTEQSSMSGHDHAQASHVHADGKAHTHDEGKKSPGSQDEQGPAAACCGLFSASAMVSETRSVLPGPVTMTTVLAKLPDLMVGQGPDRINRPPIA